MARTVVATVKDLRLAMREDIFSSLEKLLPLEIGGQLYVIGLSYY